MLPRRVAGFSRLNCRKRSCALLLLCVATAIALPAQTFTSLYSFDGTDGYAPYGGLVQGTDGDLYGTTGYGGANVDCEFYPGVTTGCGTVFKITLSGTPTLTTLYSFCSKSNCADGAVPYGTLVLATNGDFYGTTSGGGANGEGGTIFKVTAAGKLTTLYSFCSKSNCADGEGPSGLIQATNGVFYGTTGAGGTYSRGTVFKVTAAGKLTTLYSFCLQSGCADGEGPSSGSLIQATDGNLYGTTSTGGANGDGAVFKITLSGKLTTLYSFDYTDGENPNAGLAQASNGNLYGTAYYGGAYNSPYGFGTVFDFEVTPGGTLTLLDSFDGTNGMWPTAGLILATDGNLYGSNQLGGAYGVGGTIFNMSPTGTLTTLYSFCAQSDCKDGYGPLAAPVQDTNGTFYGTTWLGGVSSTCEGCEPGGTSGSPGYGTVFSLSMGLGPFVTTNPTSGKVGSSVMILGNDLTGATAVSFNGTAASFKIDSSSEIKAKVPTGATTGTVTVTTSSGTVLNSNVAFVLK